MKVNKVHAAVVAALSGVTALTYQTASAQEGLEEILVTATRREQNLQEIPISIVAITGENLELQGLDSLEDVGKTSRTSTFRAAAPVHSARCFEFAACQTSVFMWTASGRSTVQGS
jgi:iron complex outermembrane receptor protein